ncbi:hypothetical protein R9K59_24795, partial [Escherichia coli]
MNKTVLHINSNITTDEISLLLQASKYKYIHFEIIGKGDSCKNLIEFSYHDYNLKKQLIALTNAGFMSYVHRGGNDSNLLIVFYVQIMPDDFVMQLHR